MALVFISLHSIDFPSDVTFPFNFRFSHFVSRFDSRSIFFHFYLISTNEIANKKMSAFVSFSFFLFYSFVSFFDEILKADKWQFYLPVFSSFALVIPFRFVFVLFFLIAPSGRFNPSSGFDAALFCFTIQYHPVCCWIYIYKLIYYVIWFCCVRLFQYRFSFDFILFPYTQIYKQTNIEFYYIPAPAISQFFVSVIPLLLLWL